MKSYLDQLTSRALSLAPVLQPRVPTWFEPVNSSTAEIREVSSEQEAAARTLMPSVTAVPPLSAITSPPIAVSQTAMPMPQAEQPAIPTGTPLPVAEVRIERETRELRHVHIERNVEHHSTESILLQNPPAGPPLSPLMKPTVLAPPMSRTEPRTAPTLTPLSPPATVRDSVVPPPSETRIIEVPAAPAQRVPAPPPRSAITPPAVGALLPQSATPKTQAPLTAHPAATPPSRAAVPPVTKPVTPPAQPSLRPAAAPRIASTTPPTPRSEPPVIEISIGRVDVRAVSSPAPSVPPRSRAAAPMLSLDDYLRHKDGGGR